MDDKNKDINSGDTVCYKCGSVMDCEEDPEKGWFVYTCPACGWKCIDDGMEFVTDERGDEWLIPRNDMPPAGCRACGGPYPDCKPGCKMFDD